MVSLPCFSKPDVDIEIAGIFSYHAPGWSPNVEADFDPRELFIIREIYKLS